MVSNLPLHTRRNLLRYGLAIGVAGAAFGSSAAFGAIPAETFVADNIQKGLALLNDPQLSKADRSAAFQTFLLAIVDIKRIALFTLGSYGAGATSADVAAFTAAFQDYLVAVYQSYLGAYAGQTLRISGSTERAPNDFIVTTNMVGPDSSNASPLQVNFRVRTDSGRPELTDISVAGVWLALAQRDQFGAFLAQNHGSLSLLTAHLRAAASQYH